MVMGRTAQSVSRFFSLRKKKQKDWAFPEELCRRFTYAEISAATQCFDQSLCIGRCSLGPVYKGRIKVYGDDDREDVVAIKRFSKDSEQRVHQFRTEVQLLCQLRHPNLISFIGFCQENGECDSVYEYMPNRSLFDYLIDTSSINPLPLTWKQRLKICIGVARSIHYLHAGVKHAVIHRNVKCSNVLLDQNLVPKLSDFGLSKMGPPVLSNALIKLNSRVSGTVGYLDPEYALSGQLTEKSDVYSFGVVLLEVLCAKSIVELLNEEYSDSGEIFPDKIDPFLKGKVAPDCSIDPFLMGKVAPDCLIKFMNIAKRCLRLTGAERPTMGEVQVELECALELQESADAVKQLKELGTSASTSLAPPLPAHDMDDYTYENISFSDINEVLCNRYSKEIVLNRHSQHSFGIGEPFFIDSIASLGPNREAIT